MFGVYESPSLADELHRANEYLDQGARKYGLTAVMFRTFKFLFYIAVLGTTVYLIQYATVEPTLAMGFAILLISGPEALETWLIHQGKLVGQQDGGDK